MEKKRRIISYENLEPKVQELLHKKFPAGFVGHVQKIQSPKGETLNVVQLETADSIFMVKVKLNMPKKAKSDDDDDEFFGDEVPEAGDGFDTDKEEFGAGDDEEDSYGDGPAEEYDDDDKEDED